MLNLLSPIGSSAPATNCNASLNTTSEIIGIIMVENISNNPATPTAFLIRKFAKIDKGSVKGSKEIVGSLTKEQVREIAEIKLPDLNAYTIEAAMKIVEGTALNMGIKITE